jgi:hypothetical protein
VTAQPHVISGRDYRCGLLVREVLHRVADVGRTWGLRITIRREGGVITERGVITVSGPRDEVERFDAILDRLDRLLRR